MLESNGRFSREEICEDLGVRDRRKLFSIESDIEKSLLNIATEVLEIRNLLSNAKPLLPHGKLRSWVEETFGQRLPYPSVADFRAIYENPKGRPEVVRLVPVSYLNEALDQSLLMEIDASIDELQELKLDIKKHMLE